MKHRIPSITLAVVASALILLTHAAPPSESIKEGTVTYTYDASGNRIKRVGNMDASIVVGRDSSILIEIYPNPTADILNVTVNGLEDGTLSARSRGVGTCSMWRQETNRPKPLKF